MAKGNDFDVTQKAYKEIGEIRKSTIEDRVYSIREILLFTADDVSKGKAPSLEWTWTSGVDPITKKVQEKVVNHIFHRVEILGDISIPNDDDLIKYDIMICGYAFDGRSMIITIDKYDDIFGQSKIFKKLVGSKNPERGNLRHLKNKP